MNFERTDFRRSVSIIVLSYNGMEHLPDCLGSVSAQSDADCELIIVDNASSDGSAAWVRSNYPHARLIESPRNIGFCAGMNLGLRHSDADYVLFLNQDTILEPLAIHELIKAMQRQSPDVIGAFPKVVFHAAPLFINAFGVNWYESCHWRDTRVGLPDLGQFKTSERVFGSIFPAVLFRRESFIEIGAFDELFWSYCEDFDVCYRTQLFGYHLITVPGAIIRHKYRSSSRDATNPLWSRYWFIRNYLLVFLKNYELKNLWIHRYVIFMRYNGHALRTAWVNRNRAELAVYLKVLMSLFLNTPRICKRRFFIQLHRKKNDQDIWRHGVVEEHNIYHVDGCIVLSLKSLRAALRSEEYVYTVDHREYHSI